MRCYKPKIFLSMKRGCIFFLVMLLGSSLSNAQIRVSAANIDNWVKSNFSGQGVVIGNISHHGNPVSQGTFTSSGNVLQVQKGLLLSTGNVFNIPGFNRSYNLSAALGDFKESESDAGLSKLVTGALYDISYVEFDFVPMGNSLQFNYQFGSDEYPEYVGSPFNDVFAFFISDESSTRNIALVPGKSIPVSINNINSKSDSAYFIDNNPFAQTVIKRQSAAPEEKVQRSFFGGVWHWIKKVFGSQEDVEGDRIEVIPDQALVKKLSLPLYRNLQYDGITKKLVAQTYVQPYKKYHLKIIISDVSDNIYDSGVFIEDRSLTAKRDVNQPGYIDYPDLAGKFDPKLILEGKKIEDILPNQPSPKPDTITGAIRTPTVNLRALQDVVIYFDFDKSDISSSEMEKIRLASTLFNQSRPNYNMVIAGHTDNKGNLEYNYALSKRRNDAVIQALKQFIPDAPVSVVEKAYLEPAADNTSDTGRSQNRRVVISFKKK